MAVTGTSATTLNNHTSSASGSTGIAGTSAVTLDDVTSDGDASVPITGTSAVTLDDETSAAAGSVPYTASPAMTLANAASSSTAFFSHKETILDAGAYTYTCTLTGTPDATTDLTLPISSFTISLSFSERDFLTIEIPTSTYFTEINARPNGQLVITADVTFADGSTLPAPITLATADVDEVELTEAQGNAKVKMKGRISSSYSAARTIPIDSVFEYSFNDVNGYRATAFPVLALQPYDIAVLNDGSAAGIAFAVGRVELSVAHNTATMRIEEISDDQTEIKTAASSVPPASYTFYVKGRSYNTV